MKKALVCGAGGFIGGHLVRRLKADGYWVRGVDIKKHEFSVSPADEFFVLDLRNKEECVLALKVSGGFDEVYQLAAVMGGMGFIDSAAAEIMHNSALINHYMVTEAARAGVGKYFFSSSACIYPDMQIGDPEMTEEQAYPANPDNEYGWEKLFAERMLLTFATKYGFAPRIARFENCYGPQGTWRGGREKAPAAICRKIASVPNGGRIEVWGDGTAVRSYTYVDDMVDGIRRLMDSDIKVPVNIGNHLYVSVDELVKIVSDVAGKRIHIDHVDGPVGVKSRNFSNLKIRTIGWNPKVSLYEGIYHTYFWIMNQILNPK